MTKKIILASASPRRKELLNSVGLEFRVVVPEIEENLDGTSFSEELVEKTAAEKVLNVDNKTNSPAIIIGSDTVVVIEGKILGKPVDEGDALSMLTVLSGKKHLVVSAIAVYDSQEKRMMTASVTTEVFFRDLTKDEIRNYIKTGEPMDKAGAYGIQGKAALFVKGINGCYSNVVGISVYKLAEMLREFGVNLA